MRGLPPVSDGQVPDAGAGAAGASPSQGAAHRGRRALPPTRVGLGPAPTGNVEGRHLWSSTGS